MDAAAAAAPVQEAMGGDTVVTTTGAAMSYLLDKLEQKHKDGGKFLKKEWRSIHAVLHMLARVPPDELDQGVRDWAQQLRELSYMIQDTVEYLMVSEEEGSGPSLIFTGPGLMKKKIASFFNKLHATIRREEIDDAIQVIKYRVKAIAVFRPRCTINHNQPFLLSSSASTDDLRRGLTNKYRGEDVKDLVGIDKARDELIKRLGEEGIGIDQVPNQQLKTVSLVGCEGLGKTALAKLVYQMLKPRFKFRAYVTLSGNPGTRQVVTDMLQQLDEKKYQQGIISSELATWDETNLLKELKKFLQDKRFLIVIDDIKDIKAWEIMKAAWMDNIHQSRVITTTRHFNVAVQAGDIYKLQPLSHDKSEELFSAIYPAGGKWQRPHGQSDEVSKQILQKCHGIPLFIIKVAALLAGKPREDWSKVCNSVHFGYGDNADEEDEKILLRRYYDLPYHLKTCLLHLSAFPKHATIKKTTLIWKWVAEGCVPEEPGIGLFELGERYYNELLNKNMIQPVKVSWDQTMINGCQVVDRLCDRKYSLSGEENFITELGYLEQLGSQHGIVRRLAIDMRNQDHNPITATTYMTRVKSLHATNCDFKMMPSLSSYRALHVLHMEGYCSYASDERPYHIEHLGSLSQLRYLGLWSMYIPKLPEEIGKLKFLQILDLKRSKIKEWPQSVGLLSQLKCLRVYEDTEGVGDWIVKLTSLEELTLGFVSEMSAFVEVLGKLTELRKVKIDVGWMSDESEKQFVDSMSRLRKVQILQINKDWSRSGREVWEDYIPPRQLYRLRLHFHGLPLWFKSSHLPNLLHLTVRLADVEVQDAMDILGKFPELITLELRLPDGVFPDVLGGDAFPKLRHCATSAPLRFLEGAMPSIESIELSRLRIKDLKDAKFGFDFSSLGNLALLRKVKVKISSYDADAKDVKEAESAMWQAVDLLISQGRNIDVTGLPERVAEDEEIIKHGEGVSDSKQIIDDKEVDNDDDEGKVEITEDGADQEVGIIEDTGNIHATG